MASRAAVDFVRRTIYQTPWDGPVIDLGAGEYSTWYRGLFPNAQYITLDIKGPNIQSVDIITDILDMSNVKKNYYGVALLLETLEHVRNPFLAFEKISQIIRPGGIFICTTVACWGQHNHPGDYWRFLPDGLALLCEHANLKIFHQDIRGKLTSAPCNVMVAAIKG